MVPPWVVTIQRAMLNPRPHPSTAWLWLASARKNGSKTRGRTSGELPVAVAGHRQFLTRRHAHLDVVRAGETLCVGASRPQEFVQPHGLAGEGDLAGISFSQQREAIY